MNDDQVELVTCLSIIFHRKLIDSEYVITMQHVRHSTDFKLYIFFPRQHNCQVVSQVIFFDFICMYRLKKIQGKVKNRHSRRDITIILLFFSQKSISKQQGVIIHMLVHSRTQTVYRSYRHHFDAHRSSYNMIGESVKMFVYFLTCSFFILPIEINCVEKKRIFEEVRPAMVSIHRPVGELFEMFPFKITAERAANCASEALLNSLKCYFHIVEYIIGIELYIIV